MRSHEERVAEAKRRIAKIEREKRRRNTAWRMERLNREEACCIQAEPIF